MEKDLENRIRAAAGDHVPGVALVVVGPEGVRARAGMGAADLNAPVPMMPDLAAPWFSMTKIATATTTMALAERGVIDVDAPVEALAPVTRTLRPTDRAGRITPRHLLQHSAGIANPIPVKWIHPADAPGPDPDAFLEGLLAKHAKLAFEPGTRSSYSNLGTLLLGAAVARATGDAFPSVVEREVLKPTGMAATGFTYPDEVAAATGYHPRWSAMRLLLPRWVIGAPAGRWVSFERFLLDGSAYGGLVGTADDAARFLQMHLRNGELDGTRIISEDAAEEMRQVRVPGKRFDLGLGWFRPANRRNPDPPFVEHLGGGAGFFNVMRLYPTAGVGAVVMGNATKYDVESVAALALGYA
jgi:CubicO group peptidase (beta-lactamase class C family)